MKFYNLSLCIFLLLCISVEVAANNLDTGNWTSGRYIDEFGDDMGEGYIGLETIGKFSNSATTDSALKVVFILGNGSTEKPWLRIFEYAGKNPVKGIYNDSNSVECRIKDNTNLIFPLTLYQAQGWDSFYISDTKKKKKDMQKLKDLINDEGLAKFSCYNKRNTSTKYRFDLDFHGYENALKNLVEN